jgi:hypothetical protein
MMHLGTIDALCRMMTVGLGYVLMWRVHSRQDQESTVKIIRLRARELVLMGESYILPKDFASSWGGGDKFLCRGAGTALGERYDFDNLSN